MTPPDGSTVSVCDLLRQTYGLLAVRSANDTAVNAALVATVEAALGLAELHEADPAGTGDRSDRLTDVYACTRAAVTAVRFAVVEADDRLGRHQH